jgi:nitrogen-specific signal transduction histidine kinase/CheY-like chemotaxis protein
MHVKQNKCMLHVFICFKTLSGAGLVGAADGIALFPKLVPAQNGEQLGHAQKMEALGQITGGIAHELNNMLLTINLNLESLAEEVPAAATVQPLFDGAQQAIEQAKNLILQLLAFSRRQPLDTAEFDVNRAVEEARMLLRLVLPANIDIETSLSPAAGIVLADRNQFEMALLNTALNAGDAMPRGGRLTIETSRVGGAPGTAAICPGDAANYALIAVRDTGAGMAPAVAARAFEPFFTTKADLGRSGLGLSQVYGYARQSGGHVEIDSSPGGTAVRILLPCGVTSAPHRFALSGRGSGEIILMVEDAPLVRHAVCRMLSDLGYGVLTAADPGEALAIIESDAGVDLLFTDIMLPGSLRGDELAIVARCLRPGLRVLCTSGYSEIRAADLAAHGGGFELIAKPYTKAALARQLRAVFGRDTVRA